MFDWKIDSNNPINNGIVKGEDGHATFYVEVEDVKASLDKAVQIGGKVVVPETVIPNMVTFGMFTDPEGHLIGVVKSEQ